MIGICVSRNEQISKYDFTMEILLILYLNYHNTLQSFWQSNSYLIWVNIFNTF